MRNQTLPKERKIELHRIFVEKGLNPSEFVWTEVGVINNWDGKRAKVSKLKHIAQECFFTFNRYKDEEWESIMIPGPFEKEKAEYSRTWGDVRGDFTNWCYRAKTELEPDPWELAHQNKLTEASENQEDKDAKFSFEEQKLISKALNKIKEFITVNHDLTGEQIFSLNEKIEMLEKESNRMSKQPWLHTLIGVLFGIATNAAFNPIQAHDLFNFAYNCLRPVLETPLLLK